MKIGLYAMPDTNMTIRCIDGHFDRINLPKRAPSPAAHWRNIINAVGQPCDQDTVRAKLPSGSLMTYTRSVAKMLYGVPDDVELYQPGDFGVAVVI